MCRLLLTLFVNQITSTFERSLSHQIRTLLIKHVLHLFFIFSCGTIAQLFATEVTGMLRMRIAEIECPQPPSVVNTTWCEDKKSLRLRRIIYRCLPRYVVVSGHPYKECGPRGRWVGVDLVCEGRRGKTRTVQ